MLFVPTGVPRFAGNDALAGLRRLEQIEDRTLWIGHDRETADVGNVGGGSIDFPAQALHLGGSAIEHTKKAPNPFESEAIL